MEPASTRFFKVHDLMYMVGALLDLKYLVGLVRVNNTLNEICIPLIYKNLLMHTDPTAESSHPGFLLALSKNVHHVRSIDMNGNFFGLYLAGIVTLQDINHTTLGYSHNRPPWLPAPNPHAHFRMVFPPIAHLTHLKCEVDGELLGDNPIMKSYYYDGSLLAQLCYILQLSPHLVKLELKGVPVKSRRHLDRFARTIASLVKLSS
ncbi:hypothetical protein BGX23_001804 [Mortierella sp. AD031]|nr:hypothetical protein BGX23_001804 [Mortierella sp. AD031]